jgi:hypothetical protein
LPLKKQGRFDERENEFWTNKKSDEFFIAL